MAMFGKTENGAGAVRSNGGGSLSFIGREVTVTGNIGGSGNLHIDGTVEGDVAAASLILGAEGHVRGNIVADAAQISGTVDGTVAAKSLVIESTARINGDLSYDAVSVASGAQVEGRVKRLTRDAEPALKLIASE
jgi:cytoskeletal protein CcmA (bactofilin family)